MAELERPKVLFIARWERRGDLRIAVQHGEVYLRADQVELLAGIAPWSGGETLIEDAWGAVIDGEPFYELDVAIARCEMADTDTAAAFLTWLRPQLEQLLTDQVLDDAQRIPGFIGSYSIARAARILDRDPAISIGQRRLFALLHQQEWIDRSHVDADWAITPRARRNGWLTIRNIPVRTGRAVRTYPQMYVTPAGLEQLREVLHALHRHAPPDEAPAPTLFD